MKHKRLFLLTIFVGFLFSSCSKFLEENPTTRITDLTAYNTEDALESQIYGILADFHGNRLWQGDMGQYLHIASGLIGWKGHSTASYVMDSMNLTKYSSSSYGNGYIFQSLYAIIYKCNRLLDNLPDSPVDPSYKKGIEGEAKFYRAIAYYTAVRMWGDVPMLLSAPKNVAETSNPRMVWYKVYEQVLRDFTDAEQMMRTKDFVDTCFPGDSRPCNMAATAFKAQVYLTIGSLLSSPDDNFWDYSKDESLKAEGKPTRSPDFTSCGIGNANDAFTLAYNTARTVIESGVYSLVPDYRTLFRWSEEGDWDLPERIFVLPSTKTAGVNYLATYTLPQYPEGTIEIPLANSNYGRIRPDRFYYDEFIKHTGGTKGTESYTKDFYVNTTDPRSEATFIYKWYNRNAEGDRSTYPNNWKVSSVDDQWGQPYFKKYLAPDYKTDYCKSDFYFLRFAEMYLIAAEAAASISAGPGDQWWDLAFDNVEVIHKRARESHDEGVADYTCPKWDKNDYEDKESLINDIMWERCCEMACEGHEYFDTHRRGATWLRDNIAIPKNNYLMIELSAAYWAHYYQLALYPTDVQKLRGSLLCAYPMDEFRLNTQVSYDNQNDFFWE